jgi:hypothetical protein
VAVAAAEMKVEVAEAKAVEEMKEAVAKLQVISLKLM